MDRDKTGLVNLEFDVLFEQLAEGLAANQFDRIFRVKQRLVTGHGGRHRQPPGAGQVFLVDLMNIDYGRIALGNDVMAWPDDQDFRLRGLMDAARGLPLSWRNESTSPL